MQKIGPYQLANSLFLAPMVGVSDSPFREVCSEQGAGLTIGEMLTSNTALWFNRRNRLKQTQPDIDTPQVVQIAGSDPTMMAEAAARNESLGADAIDINMGCPAKKVLKKAAGSALLKDLPLVEKILSSVVNRVSIPVTLKIRTGWCTQSRNGTTVAKLAEDCGIQLLTVHGRTRACRFKGAAEYDTIAAIKQAVDIPIIANGDIDSPRKAAWVLNYTGADGVMIGRAAQGRPWIFREIQHYLETGESLPEIGLLERFEVIEQHLIKMHRFYGDNEGAWNSRKHVIGYLKDLPGAKLFLAEFNQIESGQSQLAALDNYKNILTYNRGALAA